MLDEQVLRPEIVMKRNELVMEGTITFHSHNEGTVDYTYSFFLFELSAELEGIISILENEVLNTQILEDISSWEHMNDYKNCVLIDKIDFHQENPNQELFIHSLKEVNEIFRFLGFELMVIYVEKTLETSINLQENLIIVDFKQMFKNVEIHEDSSLYVDLNERPSWYDVCKFL